MEALDFILSAGERVVDARSEEHLLRLSG
jgi:hypothetical protein